MATMYQCIPYLRFLYLSTLLFNALGSTIRIMPLGDSLVVGKPVNGGFRTPLLEALQSSNECEISFVGTKSTNPSSGMIEPYHEGHGGWNIDSITEYIHEFLDSVQDPDIILLLIGTVDIAQQDYERAIYRWSDLIEKISSLRPYSHIIAANLIPRRSNDFNDRIDTYFNPFVEGIIDNHIAAGRRVTFVDMHSQITVNDLVDAIHPSENGYRKMASQWKRAIEDVIGCNGDNYAPGIVRVNGGLDRRHVEVVFNKPLSIESANVQHFHINSDLNILDAELGPGERIITLHTTEQIPGNMYELKVSNGVVDKTPNMNELHDSSISFRVGWRFINLSDWHSAEKFIFLTDFKLAAAENDLKIMSYIKEEYSGDFLMIPGDTNSGAWDARKFRNRMMDEPGMENATPKEVVLEAGRRCYSRMISLFRKGGFWKVLLAVGDHELGDNPWKPNSLKSKLQPEFRQALTDNVNRRYDGNWKYDAKIGNVASRPFGTSYADSSFAYLHKNTLIVTVDIFFQQDSSTNVDLSGSNTVAGRVVGDHLVWFDNILREARTQTSIKHILVQGHFPILYPVRKVKSSGQMMDFEASSEFWKSMRRWNVDIYFSGEVHLNTVTKDEESNLIQIASRGNYFTNFLTIDVTDDTIDVQCHNEIGNKPVMHNYDYEVSGRFLLKKDGTNTMFESEGELEILDRTLPMIHFDFEEQLLLAERKVLALGDKKDVLVNTPSVDAVTVQGMICRFSIPNRGAFGQSYDLQTTEFNFVAGPQGSNAALFDMNTRAAVWGMGPHTGSNIVSYAGWFQTVSESTQILISFEGYWNKPNVMNLQMRGGSVELVFHAAKKLVVSDDTRINDGEWHHILVTMPSEACSMSEIEFYIDGIEQSTTFIGDDSVIDFPRGGMLAIGGFGYGGTSKEESVEREGFRLAEPFVGAMDDVLVYTKHMSDREAQELAGLELKPSTMEPSSRPSLTSTISPSESHVLRSSSPSLLPSNRLATPAPTVYRNVSPQPNSSNTSQPVSQKGSLLELKPSTMEPSSRPSLTSTISPSESHVLRSSSPSLLPSNGFATPAPTVYRNVSPQPNSSNTSQPVSHKGSLFMSLLRSYCISITLTWLI